METAPLNPMTSAPRNRTPVLARMHPDLFPRIRPERPDLKRWNGVWIVIAHPGLDADGFDPDWHMAAPVGRGGFPDEWFVGWTPLPDLPSA
jgi:hypothetical protein